MYHEKNCGGKALSSNESSRGGIPEQALFGNPYWKTAEKVEANGSAYWYYRFSTLKAVELVYVNLKDGGEYCDSVGKVTIMGVKECGQNGVELESAKTCMEDHRSKKHFVWVATIL